MQKSDTLRKSTNQALTGTLARLHREEEEIERKAREEQGKENGGETDKGETHQMVLLNLSGDQSLHEKEEEQQQQEERQKRRKAKQDKNEKVRQCWIPQSSDPKAPLGLLGPALGILAASRTHYGFLSTLLAQAFSLQPNFAVRQEERLRATIEMILLHTKPTNSLGDGQQAICYDEILSNEVWAYIFQFCLRTYNDIVNVQRVCRHVRAISYNYMMQCNAIQPTVQQY